MKRYKLKMDIPAYKCGERFHLSKKGNLVHTESGKLAYHKNILKEYPSVLRDWFEEIPEEPKTVWDLNPGDRCFLSFLKDGYPVVVEQMWVGSPMQESARRYGGLFVTSEAANSYIDRSRAKQILKRDTKGFEPDWNYKNREAKKWFVVWSINLDELVADYTNLFQENKIFFPPKKTR